MSPDLGVEILALRGLDRAGNIGCSFAVARKTNGMTSPPRNPTWTWKRSAAVAGSKLGLMSTSIECFAGRRAPIQRGIGQGVNSIRRPDSDQELILKIFRAALQRAAHGGLRHAHPVGPPGNTPFDRSASERPNRCEIETLGSWPRQKP